MIYDIDYPYVALLYCTVHLRGNIPTQSRQHDILNWSAPFKGCSCQTHAIFRVGTGMGIVGPDLLVYMGVLLSCPDHGRLQGSS